MIIAFEGIDGSGKGTQAKMLFEYLSKKGIKSVLLDFPKYDTPTGKPIKEYLSEKTELKPLEIARLFYNDQLAHKKEVEKYDDEKYIVILDRYTLSTEVYQGALGKGNELMNKIKKMHSSLRKSDMTIIFELPVMQAVERMKNRGRPLDRNEKDAKYLAKVQELYLKSAESENYDVIHCFDNDYGKTRDEIFSEVLNAIKHKIGKAF